MSTVYSTGLGSPYNGTKPNDRRPKPEVKK